MSPPICEFRLTSYAWPRDRRIGDCQVAIDTNWVSALELIDEGGETGLGFALTLFGPPPPEAVQYAWFERELWPAIADGFAEGLIHRVTRPRGGNARAALYDLDTALDQALWDLAAKHAGLPLFRFLGGREVRPIAYASGLEFHLGDAATHAFYAASRAKGYGAYKLKLGHPDLGWELARLALVRDTVGPDARLMVDANEAWTVEETRRRVSTYRAAGFAPHWVEDPILRNDAGGLVALRGSLGGTLVNAGEYLPAAGKLALIEAGAADVLQLNGGLSDGLRLGWAAAARGMPVALGNTHMNIGAHLAAALPEVDMAEDSRLNTTDLLTEPLRVEAGRFVLPEVPGHGLALAPHACERLRVRGA